MNLKKILAGITAVSCCTALLMYMPEISEDTYAAEPVSNNFEVSYEGWYGNADPVIIEAVDGAGFGGSRGMVVSGRASSDDGASSSKGFYLFGGVEYKYSMMVYSETDETFRLSVLCLDSDTDEETEKEIVCKEVKAGQWTELSASYTAPENSYEFKMTVKTDSTNNFVFDEFRVTTEKSGREVYAAAANKGLKDEFANYFRVGNILNSGTVRNSAITAMMLKDFNSIECENETKPDATLNQGQCSNANIGVKLDSAAAIFDFCSKNGIGVRGHTLVWHSQTPEWFFKDNFQNGGSWVSKDVMNQRMESYIKNMFGAIQQQYPDLNLYAYDVCNECVSDDQSRTANNGGARTPGYGNGASPWVQVYGDNSFIEKAFTYARQYAPETCKLYYNDYNEYWDHKRDCIINTILKPLAAKGVLDGMGMQSHIDSGYDTFSGTVNYLKAMDMYINLGIDVQVTELDISVDNGKFSYTDQANKYKAIFEHAMEINSNSTGGKVTAICIWGPNDANSWLSSGSNALLMDGNNNPKEAYKTLIAMLPESEWGDGSNPSTGQPAKPLEPDENGWWFHSTFEKGTDSWAGRGAAKVAQSSKAAYKDSNSLYVSGRTAEWNGTAYSLNRAFKAGEEYSFSVNVMYDSGPSTDTFYLKLQYTDADGETNYASIAEGDANKGEWVQLANTNYKIPAGASNLQIYVETPETTNDFYIDEAIGAVAGTKIDGAGVAVVAKKGDINADGSISILDLVSMKRGILKSFDKLSKSAADVNEDGTVNVADLLLLKKYLLGQIDSFPKADKPDNPTQPDNPDTPDTPSGPVKTISQYTPIVEKQVSEFETNDSKTEKGGVQYGTIEQKSYFSSFCNREKKYNVLLPANYSSSKKYPVLYVMHGYWENQDRMIIKGNGTMYTRQIIGNAIAEGAAEDMIVVFPYIYSSQTQPDCSAMDDANNIAYDNFDTVLTTELMPLIEKEYSVKTGKENTAITGFSMGGRESLNIGMKHPDLFGYVGAICPAPGASGAWKFASEEASPYLIFITAGSNDEVVYTTPNGYHDNFTKNNVPHIWHYVNGGYHGDNSIHAHLYNFARVVFKADK